MAATFVAAMNGGGSSGATVTRDAAVADGDFLVAVVYAAATLTTIPAGFAAIDSSGTAAPVATYWKIAASEPSSWSWSAGSLKNVNAVMGAFRGTSTGAAPIDVHSISANASSQNLTATGVVTTADHDLLIFCGYENSGTTAITPPSGMTEPTNGERSGGSGTGVAELAYTLDQTPAGATGNRVATFGFPSQTSYGFLIAVLPPSTTVA